MRVLLDVASDGRAFWICMGRFMRYAKQWVFGLATLIHSWVNSMNFDWSATRDFCPINIAIESNGPIFRAASIAPYNVYKNEI